MHQVSMIAARVLSVKYPLEGRWKLEQGVPALFERLGARQIQSAAAENLSKLKELLEVGRVVLQDGRQATRQ